MLAVASVDPVSSTIIWSTKALTLRRQRAIDAASSRAIITNARVALDPGRRLAEAFFIGAGFVAQGMRSAAHPRTLTALAARAFSRGNASSV